MNQDEEKIDEEEDDSWKEKAEVDRMSQITDVVLQRGKVEDEVEEKEGEERNGRPTTPGTLHMHDQT